MTSPAVLERVRRLVALTSSSFEEEARTSAFMACELIRRHGLELVAAEDAKRLPGPGRIPIKSRFAGNCVACGSRYREGQTIWWAKGQRALCAACHRSNRRTP